MASFYQLCPHFTPKATETPQKACCDYVLWSVQDFGQLVLWSVTMDSGTSSPCSGFSTLPDSFSLYWVDNQFTGIDWHLSQLVSQCVLFRIWDPGWSETCNCNATTLFNGGGTAGPERLRGEISFRTQDCPLQRRNQAGRRVYLNTQKKMKSFSSMEQKQWLWNISWGTVFFNFTILRLLDSWKSILGQAYMVINNVLFELTYFTAKGLSSGH